MQPTARPIIGFLTDFGSDGAAATCRGVMLGICPDAQIVDISHSVPKYRIAAGAFILRAALPYLPVGVHVGVVDPGVGTERRPIAILTGRGDVLIGPDNGLLVPATDVLDGIIEVREIGNRDLWLPVTSSTFHGRDIFAPVAAHLAAGAADYATVGPPLPADDVVRLVEPQARPRAGRLETEITYVDSFGNLRLAGGREELVAALGPTDSGSGLQVTLTTDEGEDTILSARFASSFGGVEVDEVLVYIDSSGNLALAENQGDLASHHRGHVGQRVVIARQ